MSEQSEREAEEIMPCPFCGWTKPRICETEFTPENRPSYCVTCLTKGCHGNVFILGFGLFETEAEAIAAWNSRAEETESQLSQALRELGEAREDLLRITAERDDARASFGYAESERDAALRSTAELRGALEQCARKFRYYEQLHRENGSGTKAAANRHMAEICDTALASSSTKET